MFLKEDLIKTLRVMKLTAFILFIACLQVNANGFGQSITLNEQHTPLEKVLSKIKEQSGYHVVYREEWMEKSTAVTVNLTNATLKAALDACFKDQPLTYSIVEKTIVLRERQTAHNESSTIDLLPIDARGRVVNEKGEPVEGVTVTVKGTKNATSTNGGGEFILTGIDEKAILIFSATNIETFEVSGSAFKAGIVRELAAKTKIAELDETIVKGYYSTTKRLNTGSVGKVDATIIDNQPVSDPLAALEGRVSGLYISEGSGTPGSYVTVNLRGLNSIANGNDPLYIIDGMPFSSNRMESSYTSATTGGGNPLNMINPADIESIEVLKDADATAIYGSRGANGVILITTRKGEAGKTKFNLNTYSGLGKVSGKMSLLNTAQYLQMRREAFLNDQAVPQSYDYDVNGAWDTTRYTDWQKKLTGGTVDINDVQASISGGNSNTQFLVSAGYRRETTVFPGNFHYSKGSLHFSLSNVSSNNKWKFLFSGSYLGTEAYYQVPT